MKSIVGNLFELITLSIIVTAYGAFVALVVWHVSVNKEDMTEYLEVYSEYDKTEYIITAEEFIRLIPKEIPEKYHLLLVETAIYESNLSVGSKQNKGVALGIMQIEPSTYADIYINYIAFRPKLAMLVKSYASYSLESLRYNTQYNILMAYIVYIRKLKEEDIDLSQKHIRAKAYKNIYNTVKGKGTIEGYLYGR